MKKIMPTMLIGILILSGIGALALTEGKSFQINNTLKNNEIFIDGPQEEWNKTYGSGRWDQGVGLEITYDGGYAIGGTKDAIDYDNGGDCWIIKTDSNGNIEWEKTYGGAHTDMCHDICLTYDGGYAIVGASRSFGAGDADLFLVKTDVDGNEEWSKTFGGSEDDYGIAIQQCSDEGFIISGATRSYGSDGAWLIKTDSSGNILWEKQFGGDYLVTVLQTLEGEYVAAGRNYYDDTSDMIVVKTDAYGNVIWEKFFGDPDCHDAATNIALTSDGDYIVTGQVKHQATEHDIVLMKIDRDGNEIWTRNFNESLSFDTGMSVEETSDGGYLIGGEVGQDDANLISPFIFDSILIKTDINGNKEWSLVFGGVGSDGCFEAHQTLDGGYIALGNSESYGAGGQDIWLVKFSSFENQRPDKPSRPSGETNGKIGEEYIYTTSTTDLDGDEIFYLFDWGNGMTSFILGPYSSGEECNASGIWFDEGNYEIRVKAHDIHGAESPWSDPLAISMPKNKAFNFNFNLLEWLFDWFPNAFPMLRHLLGL